MGIRGLARDVMQDLLRRYGYNAVPEALVYDWQRSAEPVPTRRPDTIPHSARAYLTLENPRLRELQQAYARVSEPVTTPAVWTADYVHSEDLLYFRADNPYVWQVRGRNMNEMSYALAYYYLRTTDRLGLLDHLKEDLAFGVHSFEAGGRLISRDLLDSVSELNFLERHIGIRGRSGAVVLDIGAGYGRLAYRSVTGLDSIARYYCTDAIPISTFLCEYYLRYRQICDRAQVIPLHEIKRTLADQSVDLAVNVHSFSECSLEAISWWISLLKQHRVRHVMVVPNRVTSDETIMLTNVGEDFSKVLTDSGYRLVARERKYMDPVVHKYAPSPSTQFLFALH